MKTQKITTNNHVEILIVEDSPTQADQLKDILERHNYRVSVATNGKQALALMDQQRPTLVISDILMPEMDGYELCRTIKSNNEFRNIPVILLTSLSDPADIVRGLLCAADNFIVKPYDEKYLLSRVEYILINRELRKHEGSQLGVEIFFAGQKHSITSERLQILDLLFSTYEAAVQKNIELTKSQDELKKLNELLEEKVEERTAALTAEIAEHKLAEQTASKAEELVRASEFKYRTLIENMNEGLLQVDKNEVIQFVNKRFCEMLGYTSEDLLGKVGSEILLLEEDKKFLKEKNQLRSQGISDRYEIRTKKKSGEIIWVEISGAPVYDANGVVVGSVGIHTDITERKRAEEKIKEQAELLDVDPDAILVVSLEGRILFWSKGAEHLFGWMREEAVGKQVGEILRESPFQLEQIREELLKTDRWKGESQRRTKDGKELIVESSCVLVRDNEGNPKAVYLVASDITEKKKLESQLLRAQRMDSIGRLAGGVAHDLNNILSPILLSVEMLRKKLKEEADLKILDMLESTAKRGASIVKQVLTFARGVEGERMILQPKHIINEMIDVAQETFSKSIQIHQDVAKNLWQITADSTQLHQVLMNLSVNARDAMPDGGVLTIKAENVMIDEVYSRSHPDAKPGPYVLISIIDTGNGMPPDIIDKIFDPFYTTKEIGKGTGLGLSTVLGIVKSHNGFINVYSEVGRGTTFKIYLPASVTAEAQKEVGSVEQIPTGNGELIIVADDEAVLRNIICGQLETYGYRVLGASDGTEALAFFAKNTNEVSVVITDYSMPYMDGPATIRAIRKMKPDVKIIAMSGLPEDRSNLDGESSVQAFLQKPFTSETLLKALHEVLIG